MIRRRAKEGETIRLLVPNMDAMIVLPPGTTLEVSGYVAEQPSSCLAVVHHVPVAPAEYNVVVPRGSKVNVHEE